MNYQKYIDNMVELLEKYKYRASIVSELDWGDEYFYLQLVSVTNSWLSERFSIVYKNRNNRFYFYINLNLHDSDLTKRDTALMMAFWKESVELCDELNKLKIPYTEEFDSENGLINFFKSAYKKRNKRFSVYKV